MRAELRLANFSSWSSIFHIENVRWNAFCKVFPECFDLYLEHDDNVALVEYVAGSIDGHPGEVLDLLWVPDANCQITMIDKMLQVSEPNSEPKLVRWRTLLGPNFFFPAIASFKFILVEDPLKLVKSKNHPSFYNSK